MIRGIDSDNYDGNVPLAHFEMLRRDYDVRFNNIGLEARMPYAKQQKESCEVAGIVVPLGYKFLYWTDGEWGPNDDLTRMQQACAFGKPIAIDEEYETNWSPSRILERIGLAKDLLIREGFFWGHYTAPWWWIPKTRDSHDFRGDKLWHAAYPFGNRLPPKAWLPPDLAVAYGGWTQATVHQYANNCYGDEAGPWAFDMNAADESLITPPAPPPQPAPWITAVNTEFLASDRARFTVYLSDGTNKVVEA